MGARKNMACSESSYSQNIYFFPRNIHYTVQEALPLPQQLHKVLHYCCLAAKFYPLLSCFLSGTKRHPDMKSI